MCLLKIVEHYVKDTISQLQAIVNYNEDYKLKVKWLAAVSGQLKAKRHRLKTDA
jgi:hypothetical protein